MGRKPKNAPVEQAGAGGRDAKSGQWLPGTSGNPAGREKGPDFLTMLTDGLKRGETLETVFLEIVANLRRAGKKPALAAAAGKVLLDRIFGPLAQKLEHSGGVSITLATGVPPADQAGDQKP